MIIEYSTKRVLAYTKMARAYAMTTKDIQGWLFNYQQCIATESLLNHCAFSTCTKKIAHSQKSNHWIFNDHNCPRKNLRTDSEAKHFPDANAGPFGDFDLSDMDLSLTSLCEGSNNVQESLMDISFPLSGDSSCVGSASSGGGSFSGGGGISVGSGGGISGINSGSGIGVSGGGSSVGSGSGRGVGGGSKGGSINNSIEGGGSVVVVVVVADPPPDIDSDSDDKFFDTLSNSHGVKCQIEY